MLVVTWNVNSLNARMHRVVPFLEQHRPDVVCLQETKCSDDSFPHLELQAAGWVAVDHNSGGRDGVALLVRDDHPIEAMVHGLAGEPHPHEARWVEAEVGGTTFVSVYVINGRSVDDPMFTAKLEMLDAMRDRVAALRGDGGGSVCVAGDMNIAPSDDDVWDRVEAHGSTHVTPEERARLQAVLDAGVADAWAVAPERGEHEYTWWDYRAGNFHKNKGMRIDLGLLSPDLVERLVWVGIDRDYRKGTKPSDHAPLLFRLDD